MPSDIALIEEERKLSRRRWLKRLFLSMPLLAAIDTFWWEPSWLKVTQPDVGLTEGRLRIVHLTDLHHKGRRGWLEKVVTVINSRKPDVVCFTGDLVEKKSFLPETLDILKNIQAPIFGVPGNHDDWSGINFDEVRKAFRKSGGDWLEDASVTADNQRVVIHGATMKQPLGTVAAGERRVLMFHYPKWVEKVTGKFDLMLAGHSHGGQVRLPFIGALMVPYQVGRYDLGLFPTKAGPLYVSAGIGTFMLNVRFNCRPELAVFEV